MSGIFGSTPAASTSTLGDLKSDVALSDPPTDTVTSLSFSPAPNGPDFLAVSSWDNKVRIYEIAGNGQSQGRHAYGHEQPVLDCDFSKVGCLGHTKTIHRRLGTDNSTRMAQKLSLQAQTSMSRSAISHLSKIFPSEHTISPSDAFDSSRTTVHQWWYLDHGTRLSSTGI